MAALSLQAQHCCQVALGRCDSDAQEGDQEEHKHYQMQEALGQKALANI